jgi:hypothetical protein
MADCILDKLLDHHLVILGCYTALTLMNLAWKSKAVHLAVVKANVRTPTSVYDCVHPHHLRVVVTYASSGTDLHDHSAPF